MARVPSILLGLGVAALCLPLVWGARAPAPPRAKSYLGQRAPAFIVEKWLTPEPKRQGKYLLIDFWATWCRPCLDGVPMLNDFHQRFRDQVVVIGVTDESEETVAAKRRLLPKMDYSVAIDTLKRMHGALEIRAIPHAILIDPAGIVRWQGCPLPTEDNLTAEVIQKILDEGAMRPPIGLAGREAIFASYGPAEVDALRAALATFRFPAPEGAVARLLPRPVQPLPVELVNWMADLEKKGRVGGHVTEYWLNPEHVLRVAAAKYFVKQESFQRDEWAVILTRAERDKYARPIYPGEVGRRSAASPFAAGQ